MATPIKVTRLHTIDIPGATQITANAINNHGVVVGQYSDAQGQPHGFLYDNGSVCTIDRAQSTSINILGLNNLGQLVGMYTTATGTFGFLYDRGTFSPPLTFPGSTNFTVATGINDRGEIVGLFQSSTPGEHAFLLKAGEFRQLIYPGAHETGAEDINENGQIVGKFPDSSGTHGFVYLENVGVFTPALNYPGADITALKGINNEGQVVGVFTNSAGDERPFLYVAAAANPIEIPNAKSASVNGINDHGQIVGNVRTANGLVAFIGLVPN